MPRVIEMRDYGAPDVLRVADRRAAELLPDEVALRPVLIGINRADCFIRSGEWKQAGAFPYVPGLEACGTVEAIGESVRSLKPGDRVITMMQRLGGIHGERPGGYQEIVTVEERVLARVPDALELETAALLGLPAVTAFLAIEALDVAPGARVLVHGGASAVGTMALQILRARGAETIATGTREEKFPLARRAGAGLTVSTRNASWDEQVGTLDRVFDLVGQATFAKTVNRLAPGGKLVFVGGTSGGDLAFSGWVLMRPVTLTGYSSEHLGRDELERAMREIAVLRQNGAIEPLAVERYPFHEAARAHADMEAGRAQGRVVLEPP